MKRMIASCLIVFLISAICMAVVYGNSNGNPDRLSPAEETLSADHGSEEVFENQYKLDLPLAADPERLSPAEETSSADHGSEEVFENQYRLDLPLEADPDGFVSLVLEYSFTGIFEPNLEILSLPTLPVRFETRFDGTEAILCGSVTFVLQDGILYETDSETGELNPVQEGLPGVSAALAWLGKSGTLSRLAPNENDPEDKRVLLQVEGMPAEYRSAVQSPERKRVTSAFASSYLSVPLRDGRIVHYKGSALYVWKDGVLFLRDTESGDLTSQAEGLEKAQDALRWLYEKGVLFELSPKLAELVEPEFQQVP